MKKQKKTSGTLSFSFNEEEEEQEEENCEHVVKIKLMILYLT